MRRFALFKRLALAVAASLCAAAGPGFAAEMVDVSVPAGVSFLVYDVGAVTASFPAATTLSFSAASLDPGRAFSISVSADAPDFTPPSGPAIPATNVSWTASGAVGGTGFGGSLSDLSYAVVYESIADPSSGSVDLAWLLAPPGGGIRAGDHTLVVRWKLESVVP